MGEPLDLLLPGATWPRRLPLGRDQVMLLLLVMGVVGAVLHLRLDLGASGQLVAERLLRGAPLMAPLLFSNMGLVGLVALLPERQGPRNRDGPSA